MEQPPRRIDLESVDLHRLVWAGPVTVAAAVAVVLIVRWVAVLLLAPPPTFSPLGVVAPVAFTGVLVIAAIVVFAIVGCVAERPIRAYRAVALIALLLSFLPCVGVATASVAGAGWPAATALAAMHIAAWAVTVTLLEWFTAARLHTANVDLTERESTTAERCG